MSMAIGTTDKETRYLNGKLLVATPLLNNTFFEHAVIYVCIHNELGAMGIQVNHPVNDVFCSDILAQSSNISIPKKKNLDVVYVGGPVETNRGFILHTPDYQHENSHPVTNQIYLTSTLDTLKDIVYGKGPHKSLVALGYAGWEAGQLEQEILESSWIIIPASDDIIFSKHMDKWEKANSLLGISQVNFPGIAGRA